MTIAAQSEHVTPRILGSPSIRLFEVETATVIKAGSFVCYKSGVTDIVIPASSVADAGDAVANKEAVADVFVGVALDGSDSGKTDQIRVAMAPTQLYLKLGTAAAIDSGDTVSVVADADNGADDEVIEDTTSQIAVCVKSKSSTTEKWFKAELLRTKQQSAEEQS